MKTKLTIYVYRCPKCGQFVSETSEVTRWAFGETTGEPYLYCDDICYEGMEFPDYLQQENYHEE